MAETGPRIAFATPELLWAVLTEKRWQILKAICGAGPLSISETALRLDRDLLEVHGDIEALLAAGIVERCSDGRIQFPYDAIKVEFLLKAA